MSRHFLVESIEGSGKFRDYMWGVVGIAALALAMLALMSLAQVWAQSTFPKGNDALAKFNWEQTNFAHYCLLGRLRAVNFNNLSQLEKAALAEATEEQLLAAIKSRCIIRWSRAPGTPGVFLCATSGTVLG